MRSAAPRRAPRVGGVASARTPFTNPPVEQPQLKTCVRLALALARRRARARSPVLSHALAEIGILFLLFEQGLELTLDRLAKLAKVRSRDGAHCCVRILEGGGSHQRMPRRRRGMR